jgi:FMN phosphatase YigB (HAD superfamily)
MKIKALFWDIGGVLFDDIEAPMIKYISKEYALDFNFVMKVRHKWWKLYATNKITEREYWRGLLKEINIQKPIETFIQLPYTKYIIPKEEMIKLTIKIKLPQYITSDHSMNWFNFAKQKTNFIDNFEKAFLSFDLGILKSRKFYEIVLKDCSFKPEDVLIIDNSKKIINLVVRMGFNAIQFQNFEQFQKELNNYIRLK